jgi:hypothetical protein
VDHESAVPSGSYTVCKTAWYVGAIQVHEVPWARGGSAGDSHRPFKADSAGSIPVTSTMPPESYLDEKPDGVENTYDKEWAELSYQQQYYLVHRDKKVAQKKKRREEKRAWLREKKREMGCSRCEESHPACIDFHHTNGDKKNSVAGMMMNDRSKEAIEEEIEKCIPLCANCHRKEHY